MVDEGPERRTGFPSLYQISYTHWDHMKNGGYDYATDMMKRSLSNYMFRNPHLATFLEKYLQPIMVKYVNMVKYVRIYYNYAVPKDYEKIN